MSVFTRRIPSGEVLNTLNLRYNTRNQITTGEEIELWYTMMRAMTSNIFVWPITTMNGYQPTPERYWIRTSEKTIMLYVEADENEPEQRFVWKTQGTDDVVITYKITKDSIVFLKVQGDTLSYAGGNKLLFVECEPQYKHPIKIAFVDDFGLTQILQIETGEWSSTYSAEQTFKSISHDIKYDLGKTSTNILTVGDTSIPRELMLFYDGLIKSPAYKVVEGKTIIDTHLSECELVANTFTKTYSVAGKLQFNTVDIPTLQFTYGELNLND